MAIDNFGFWIADFGLEIGMTFFHSIRNPKSAIQNGLRSIDLIACRARHSYTHGDLRKRIHDSNQHEYLC